MSMFWRPIETCPLHTDVLFYRGDAGVFMGQFTSLDSFMTSYEIEKSDLSDEALCEPDYWSYDFDGGHRCDGDLKPTHWMPTPDEPT